MEQKKSLFPPHRITDLVSLKKQGAHITLNTDFEVIPVDFLHRENPYQAFVFICYFSGTVDGKEYSFRKCYARGCPHNLCPHVSQAVMIANRYLVRDYRMLKDSGIDVEEKLFSLEDMLVKFEGYKEDHDPTLTIHDYINMAKEGTEVSVKVEPEYVPAVEHFANYENAQTFLTVNFTVSALGKEHTFQRCFACYATDNEAEEKEKQVKVANERLDELYRDFEQAKIKYEKNYFS